MNSLYLKNEYEPIKIQNESKDWEALDILFGEIPEEINGYFLRNSSNPQFIPSHKYHWFDGDGFIQGVKIRDGKAFFKGKFIRTKKFIEEKKAGKSLYGGLNNPINKNNFFKTLRDLFQFSVLGKNPFPNTSNTDLVYHHGTLFSLWLLCDVTYKIDLETLETLGEYDFGTEKNDFTGVSHGICAHPKISPKDGKLFVMDFVSSWKRRSRPFLHLSSVSEDNEIINTKKIEISGRNLLHDMAITENYVIVIDLPAEMSPLGLKYRQNKPARFGILKSNFEEKDNEIKWFVDPSGCYIVHIINAYEENDKIVLYGLRKPHLEISKKKSNAVTDVFDGYLHKWTFNLLTGEIENEIGEDQRKYFPIGSEFPTINENYEGLKNRYSYLPHISRTEGFNFNGFSKFDHEKNTYQSYKYPENKFMGEIRLIDKLNANGEDDGWLLTFTHDLTVKNEQFFVEIFDAKNIEKGPVCVLKLPYKIPIGFHTVWVDEN